MPTIVQFRRGTQTQNNNFLGSAGELSVNTNANSLRVHDGTQIGGYELARADLSNVSTGILTSLSVGSGFASTEVISSSRQLKNITSIDANTKSVLASSILDNINTPSGIITAAFYYGSGINLSGVVTSIVAGSGIQVLTSNTGIVTVTATGGGSSGGGGISAIQLQNDGIVVGSAGTFNFTSDFAVPTVSEGIGTISISQTKTLNLNSIQAAVTGTGFIGTIGNSWGAGHFRNLNVDNVINVREAIDLEDGDILRFGTSDDAQVLYNGSSNKLILDLQTDCTDFVISSSSSAKFTFNKSNGRLGIGSDVPSQPLDVIGNINSTGTVSASNFDSTSDISLKTNISKIDAALDLISQIDGVRFDWVLDNKPSMGVIAQNIESVVPELVSLNDDVKRVNYNGIIAILVESVKELKSEVEYLRQKIL